MSKGLKIALLILVAAGVFFCVMLALTIGVGFAMDESIQRAVQPIKYPDVWADSLASSASVTIIPDWTASAGADFATSFACSLLAYSSGEFADDSTYQHFEADETFTFPYPIDSVLVVNKDTVAGFHRWWFWRR